MPSARLNRRIFVLAFLVFLTICIALVYRRRDQYHIKETIYDLGDRVSNIVDSHKAQKSSPLATSLPDAEARPPPPPPSLPTPSRLEDALNEAHAEHHIIDDLLRSADSNQAKLLSRGTRGVQEAADAYTKKRGRQPPPRFEQWVRFAEENNAVIIEEFFDRIYDDLNPFWAMNPRLMRESASSWQNFLSIRAGEMITEGHDDNERMKQWGDMLAQIAHLLPDVDLAMNCMDESRVFAPWETVNHYMAVIDIRRQKVAGDGSQKPLLVHDYPVRPVPTNTPGLFDHHLTQTAPVWSLAREACSPATPARAIPFTIDLSKPPVFPEGHPNGSFHGYISNVTYAKDVCLQPHLRGLHGTIIEPIAIHISPVLFPLFGESKLSTNQDILIPSPRHWVEAAGDSPRRPELDIPWESKENKLVWRGPATGGRSRITTWPRFHRHRFVSMLDSTHINNTQISQAHQSRPETYPSLESGVQISTFPLPDPAYYPVAALSDRHLGTWVSSFASAAFTDLECFPRDPKKPRYCSYTDPFYSVEDDLKPREQFNYRYLPDLDTNGFSLRFRDLLRSTSLPLKATLYTEWYDARIVPWKHYVPLDVTYKDLWGVMDYFLGYDPSEFENEELEAGFVRDPNQVQKLASKQANPMANVDDGEISGHEIRHPEVQPPITEMENLSLVFSEEMDTNKNYEKLDVIRRDTTNAASSSPQQSQPQPRAQSPPQQKSQSTTSYKRKIPGHDAAARHIAESGAVWADRVLRREDMLVYVYRLVLEYARICAEEREGMVWSGAVSGAGAGPAAGGDGGVKPAGSGSGTATVHDGAAVTDDDTQGQILKDGRRNVDVDSDEVSEISPATQHGEGAQRIDDEASWWTIRGRRKARKGSQ